MELKYLTTFRTIVEEGSFSAAAEKLNYTQPSITFQIGQLEKETSCKLFEKACRQMSLSSACKAFVPYVNRVLDSAEPLHFLHGYLSECAGELKNRNRGNVSVLSYAGSLQKNGRDACESQIFHSDNELLRHSRCFERRRF